MTTLHSIYGELEKNYIEAEFDIDGRLMINDTSLEDFIGVENIPKFLKSLSVDNLEHNSKIVLESIIEDYDKGLVDLGDTFLELYCHHLCIKISHEFYEGCEQTMDCPGEPPGWFFEWELDEEFEKISTEITNLLKATSELNDCNILFELILPDDWCNIKIKHDYWYDILSEIWNDQAIELAEQAEARYWDLKEMEARGK